MCAQPSLNSRAASTAADHPRLQVSHSVAALTRARTFQRLYISQLVDVVARANVHDRESKFFEGVDYYSQENEREPRRPWTRCARSLPSPLTVPSLTGSILQLL